jgi:hypothetical protein
MARRGFERGKRSTGDPLLGRRGQRRRGHRRRGHPGAGAPRLGRGITLSTVGFGMGNYNDVLMEKLANQGDGNYFYVDGPTRPSASSART